MNIALFHPGGGMGDLLLTYPVIRAFRDAYPGGNILYVTSPGMEEIIRMNPLVSEVISLPEGISAALHLAGELNQRKINIACALWTTARIAWLLKLASIPVRIGQGERIFYSFLFTHQVKVRSAYGDLRSHWVECLLDYPRSLGLNPQNKEIRVELSSSLTAKTKAFLNQQGIADTDSVIVIHCGKGEKVFERGWPVQQFALLGDLLAEKGVEVVFTGSHKEVPMVEAVCKGMKHSGHSVAGMTDFSTLASILQLARVVICPDSGPMHLAAAVGTPVVALFLMKNDFPERWAPWGVPSTVVRPDSFPCRTWCTKESCPDFLCYQKLPVEEIVNAANHLLQRAVSQ